MIVGTATLAEACLAHLMQTVITAMATIVELETRDLKIAHLLRHPMVRTALLIGSGDIILLLAMAMGPILVADMVVVIGLDYPMDQKLTDDILSVVIFKQQNMIRCVYDTFSIMKRRIQLIFFTLVG